MRSQLCDSMLPGGLHQTLEDFFARRQAQQRWLCSILRLPVPIAALDSSFCKLTARSHNSLN